MTTAESLDFVAEDKFLGCCCVTARYTTKVTAASVAVPDNKRESFHTLQFNPLEQAMVDACKRK
ncbi:hypothetical protein HK103_007518 [Boothiomyces macroporosus]|uniref:Uncharacterized protein n=1 Tax=Boothiomyces macroporosus TaxID=261099 RepID=A0AAD5Y1S5_9FUNG|nr:hypothetical protein HK103_007518 [Boothiomyces macroporosus]